MDSLQREALQNFVDDGEKDHPPVFAGRQDVLQDVLVKARRTGERQGGIPGNTTVIQGAPGAGKSSVLSELEIQAPHVADARVVKISNTDLIKAIPAVTRAIAIASASEPAQWLDLWARMGSKWIQTLPYQKDFQIPLYTDLTDLQQNRASTAWNAPVIVAVDEVQRLAPDKTATYARFLQQIHDASTGLPVTLVLAGLGDTQSVIRNLGLIRGLQPHSLGCFTPEERVDLTEEWCAHFGIRIGDRWSEIDTLMEATDGWPRHVHWAQQALAEALLVEGVKGNADRIVDWVPVQARSNQLRQGYYNTQYSDVMKYSPKLTGQVLHDVGSAAGTAESLDASQIRQRIRSYCENDQTGDYECPPGQTHATFITHLIHCGALEEDPDTGTLICPIPSFQSYILRRGGKDPSLLLPPRTDRSATSSSLD